MIADSFYKKFSDIAPREDTSSCPECDAVENIQPWMLSVEEVDGIICKKMKHGKAAVVDNLTLERVVYSHPCLVWHLFKLFHLMLKHSYVPNRFGYGIVIPLVKDKNGDTCSSEKYQGITISPAIWKIFEYLLLNFQPFLNNIDLKVGFKKHMGCGSAVYTFQQVVKYFNLRSSNVFVTALDASKAFDRLDHRMLFNKLKAYMIPLYFIGIIVCWYIKLYSAVQ